MSRSFASCFAVVPGVLLALSPVAVATQQAPVPQAPAVPAAPAAVRSGVYLDQPGGAEPVFVAQSTSQDVETKGIMKSVLTQGFSGPKFLVRHAGAAADLQVTDPQPSFIFRFPPPQRGRPTAMDFAAMQEAMDGLPMQSTHPKEFALVPMTVEEGARVLDTGKLEKLKFTIVTMADRTFLVRPEAPLPPGEYAFFLADKGKGGGMPTQIWAFSRR